MDESEVRLPAMNVAKDIQKKLTENGAAIIAEGEQALTKKSSLNFLNKLTDFYTNTMVAGLQKGGMPARMLSEGIEETMEEVTTDLIKASTHVLDALGVKVTENNGELDFGITPEEPAPQWFLQPILPTRDQARSVPMYKRIHSSRPPENMVRLLQVLLPYESFSFFYSLF